MRPDEVAVAPMMQVEEIISYGCESPLRTVNLILDTQTALRTWSGGRGDEFDKRQFFLDC